jgi:hypothetical protein
VHACKSGNNRDVLLHGRSELEGGGGNLLIIAGLSRVLRAELKSRLGSVSQWDDSCLERVVH